MACPKAWKSARFTGLRCASYSACHWTPSRNPSPAPSIPSRVPSGAHATAADLAAFLDGFASTDGEWLSVASRREMRAIQTGAMRPRFGLGWQRDPADFGAACSAETFGHFGSTGTMAWHDPATDTTFVLLTTRPAMASKASLLLPASEIIARARA